MSVVSSVGKGIRTTFVLWLICAIAYPLLILVVGFIFPYQANGSVMTNNQGQVIGSALIGQAFTSDRYFTNRPSTIEYSQADTAKPTGVSGASNLAPSNSDLLKRVTESAQNLKNKQIQLIPADLVYTSGSGLDPHISPEAAQAQLARVAQQRGLQPQEITALINKYTERRFLGIFGEPGVNVLKLNYALDSPPGS
jgi:K+-transporting ATPase ATPase C chain